MKNNNKKLHPQFTSGFMDGEACFGLNICENSNYKAGSRLGCEVSTEIREKISVSMRGRQKTDETKINMVASWSGRELSEAQRANWVKLNERANNPECIAQSIQNLSKFNSEQVKPVKVTDIETGNFVEYESTIQAAKALNTSKTTVRNYIKSQLSFHFPPKLGGPLGNRKYRLSIISRSMSTLCAQKITKIPVKNLANNKQASISRHFPVATSEWHNSVYTYNPKSTISLLVIDQMIIKIITSYLNSFYLEDQNKNHFPLVRQKIHSHWSAINIYVNKPELKHTNSKVIITLYVYASFPPKLGGDGKTFDWLYKYIDDRMFNQLDYKNQFYLSDFISKFYNKKVVFRIIQVRYLQQNTSFLVEYLSNLLTTRKISALTALRKTLKMVRIPSIKRLNIYNDDKICLRKISLLNNISNVSVENFKQNKIVNKYILQNQILASTKYKRITGVRLELAGRLTRRNTAARAVFKVQQAGILKNIDSSWMSRSVVNLRGTQRPNLDFSSFSSKTRNGAFNVRAWTSSYYSTLAFHQVQVGAPLRLRCFLSLIKS